MSTSMCCEDETGQRFHPVSAVQPSAVGRAGRTSYVTLATTEGPQLLLDELLSIAEMKLWVALQRVRRQQAVWLARELVWRRANGAERLCWALLRNLQRGDLSDGNLLLAEQLLVVAKERSGWLDQFLD